MEREAELKQLLKSRKSHEDNIRGAEAELRKAEEEYQRAISAHDEGELKRQMNDLRRQIEAVKTEKLDAEVPVALRVFVMRFRRCHVLYHPSHELLCVYVCVFLFVRMCLHHLAAGRIAMYTGTSQRSKLKDDARPVARVELLASHMACDRFAARSLMQMNQSITTLENDIKRRQRQLEEAVSLCRGFICVAVGPLTSVCAMTRGVHTSQDTRSIILDAMRGGKYQYAQAATIAAEIAKLPPGTFTGRVFGPVLAEVCPCSCVRIRICACLGFADSIRGLDCR
jgi:hypothetical protein